MSADAIFVDFPILTTPRLVLRQIRSQDAPAVFRLFADAEVTRYYDLDRFTEPAQAHELVERFQWRFDHQVGIRWGLALSEMSDKLVGTCGYNIWLQPARAHWRRGLMSEALAAILEFCFVRMNLNRVEALTIPQNTASIRLLAKLGFRAEGLLREYDYIKGVPQDMSLYALLCRERRQ